MLKPARSKGDIKNSISAVDLPAVYVKPRPDIALAYGAGFCIPFCRSPTVREGDIRRRIIRL
ncbi:MAG: hypothetical protein ACRD6X_13865 [Pyrinomonadaceae bacterium]